MQMPEAPKSGGDQKAIPRTALLLGASGLVGGFCLRALLEDPAYGHVALLGRRELTVPAQLPAKPRLTQKTVSFENLTAADFANTEDIFCALGTTIRKAGSQEAFRRVDHEYPLAAAKLALNAGAKQFILVSSVGADPGSKNFYLRTKGELEQAVSALGFQAVHIFRPGILLGKREEFRAGERVAAAIAPALNLALIGGLRRYRAIQAATVGTAMVAAARRAVNGTHVYEYDQIVHLAG
jgi:uncharacterized protein YbjT (DUF2867 family)